MKHTAILFEEYFKPQISTIKENLLVKKSDVLFKIWSGAKGIEKIVTTCLVLVFATLPITNVTNCLYRTYLYKISS